MSSLYEITGEMLTLQQMAEEESAEDILQVIHDTLWAVDGEHDVKMEGYAKVIRNLEAQTKAIKDEEQRLASRRKTIESNIDRLKAAMLDSMRALGKTKAGGDIFTISVQKNGGKAPLLLKPGVLPLDVPEEFQDIRIDFDKESIREALVAGRELDFAAFGERGESIRIR